MNKLKPCPFCGGTEIRENYEAYIGTSGREGTGWGIWCPECGALGPEKLHRIDAVNAWNERSNEVDWVPVAESLPPEDTVIVLRTADGYCGTGIWHGDSWRTNDAYVEYEPITHWYRLPDLTEVKE